MIEFKQIIGRGTRLYDGKDYFTIYDFVKAHHHFSDPEWDGEPMEPEPKPEPKPRLDPPPPELPGPEPEPGPRRQKIKVKLADGKARTIQHMMVTSFWHPDGTPMSAQQFMEMLFGKLPEFFKDEDELRALWSAPDTRAKLLQGLAEAGFGGEQLAEMQKIIDAEKSDLFDVLAHVAYALPPLTREERATKAKVQNQHPLQHQTTGLSRFCAVPIRQGRRAGTGPGETGSAAEAQVQQRHRRRRGRLGQTGRDWTRLLRVPEVPLPAGRDAEQSRLCLELSGRNAELFCGWAENSDERRRSGKAKKV